MTTKEENLEEQEQNEETIGDQIEHQQDNEQDEDVKEDVKDDLEEQEEEDEELGEGGKRALIRERKERKRLEQELRELQRKAETDDERKLREAREEAANEASTTWKTRFVKSEARSALVEAGVTKNHTRLLNLIDLDAIEIDEDGDVSGLDDQITELKDDFPELFERKRRVGKGDVGDKREAAAPKTIGEQIEAQLRSRK